MRKAIVLAISSALLAGAFVGPASARRAASPRITFEASGQFDLLNALYEGHFGGDIAASIYGITGNEFATRCTIPQTQEFDGYVIELPDDISKVRADVTLDAHAEIGDLDAYMVFFDAHCDVTHAAGVRTADDDAVMPAGTKYILVTARLGGLFSFDLKAVERR